jgi:hypothetical protein
VIREVDLLVNTNKSIANALQYETVFTKSILRILHGLKYKNQGGIKRSLDVTTDDDPLLLPELTVIPFSWNN